jgi:hypothetical protein
MPRKPLRSQLNQVRAWVRQGRTDAWIAHQLDVPASELKEFRRRHGLEADGEDETGEVDLRDEIEAEIEAAAAEEAEAEAEAESEAAEEGSDEDAEAGDEAPKPRRRRRRRGGRGGAKRAGASLQASFDHGEADGYGLWLDPAVTSDPIYNEHWTERRKVEVTIEPDRIVIVPASDD